MDIKRVWIPEWCNNIDDAQFFAVDVDDGSNLSKEKYATLFYEKVVELVGNNLYEGVEEDINHYYPSVFIDDESLNVRDIAWKILEAPEFYYGFPLKNDECVNCISLKDAFENGQLDIEDDSDFDEYFDEDFYYGYELTEFLNYTSELHNEFLTRNSEHEYDSKLSLSMMKAPVPDNNEFEAAEKALRDIGSNVWFGGLSKEWQEFLVSNTVECFDNYQVTIQQAANEIIKIYQKLVNSDPSILQSNPWDTEIKFN